MNQSRIASKARGTIPAPVRKALRLKEGDLVAWRIEEGSVVVTRSRPPGRALRRLLGVERRRGHDTYGSF